MKAGESAQALVTLADVSLRYRYGWSPRSAGNKYNQALSNITLAIHRGEKLGIVGRNGAGKSSLMRVFAGILGPDEGAVERTTEKALMLSLQVGFKQHLTGRENAVLSGLYQGIAKSDIERLMPQIHDYSELGDHFDRPIATYSIGMRSRLGIATAIHCRPELLILDEVFAVGDRVFKQKSRETLIDKIQSDNAVILASHDNKLIAQLCNRVVWLDEGRIRLHGTPDEVLPGYEEYCKELEDSQRNAR
jgi:lipopolysaccharide transport system ATP-binding protein